MSRTNCRAASTFTPYATKKYESCVLLMFLKVLLLTRDFLTPWLRQEAHDDWFSTAGLRADVSSLLLWSKRIFIFS